MFCNILIVYVPDEQDHEDDVQRSNSYVKWLNPRRYKYHTPNDIFTQDLPFCL